LQCNENGLCSVTAGTCDPQGAACVSGSSCCSGRCGEQGTCLAGNGGCNLEGDSCTSAADCCSLGCDNGTCSQDAVCV
jgi:hypothetical protein